MRKIRGIHYIVAPIIALMVLVLAYALSGQAGGLPYVPAGVTRGVPSESGTDVRAAAVSALVVHQQIASSNLPALGAAPTLRSAPSTIEGPFAGNQISEPSLELLHATKVNKIQRHFSGKSVERELMAAENIRIASRDPDFRALDSGVADVTFKSVSVSGSHADVKMTANAWASMAQKTPNGRWTTAVPHNAIDINMALDMDSSGRWLVSTFAWTFAPGSEP